MPTNTPAFVHSSAIDEDAPPFSSIEISKLPEAAFAEGGTVPFAWAYPHHWVEEGQDTDGDGRFDVGEFYLHIEGLERAWSLATGRVTGKVLASEAVLTHLRQHFRELGYTQAQMQALSPRFDLTGFDKARLASRIQQLLK